MSQKLNLLHFSLLVLVIVMLTKAMMRACVRKASSITEFHGSGV